MHEHPARRGIALPLRRSRRRIGKGLSGASPQRHALSAIRLFCLPGALQVIALRVQTNMLDAMYSRKRAIEVELAQTRKQARYAQAKLARAKAAQAREWTLTAEVWEVAMTIYLLADYHTEPVVAYLKRIGRERHYKDKCDAEVANLVIDTFLSSTMDELLKLVDDEATRNAIVTSTAVSYVDQWLVAEWTLEQNRKGVAPSTSAVLSKFEAIRLARPEALRLPTLGLSTSSASRKEVCRWRKRFGGRIGKIRPREGITLEELQFKVSSVAVVMVRAFV